MMESNQLLSESTTYQNTGREKKEYACNLCIAINSSLLDKNRTQGKVKRHIQQ